MTSKCPSKYVLAVEHPAVVKDVQAAINTLGGASALKAMADDPNVNDLELRMRPEDMFEHPVISSTAKTANLLVKVNVQHIVRIDHEEILMQGWCESCDT